MGEQILKIEGTFDVDRLDDFCGCLTELPNWRPSIKTRIDLGSLEKLCHPASAMLFEHMRDLRRREVCNPLKDYVEPTSAAAASCLKKEALASLISGEPVVDGSDEYGSFELYAPIEGRLDVDRLANRLCAHLTNAGRFDRSASGAIWSLIYDLGENVLTHSESGSGFVVASYAAQSDDISLSVADCGIGIRRSLLKNPKHQFVQTDGEAIRIAGSVGVTSDPSPIGPGGTGLYSCFRLATVGGGSIHVRSGTAVAVAGKQDDAILEGPTVNGTLVTIAGLKSKGFSGFSVGQALDLPATSNVGPTPSLAQKL